MQEQLLRDPICLPLAAQHHQLAFAVTFLTPSAPVLTRAALSVQLTGAQSRKKKKEDLVFGLLSQRGACDEVWNERVREY